MCIRDRIEGDTDEDALIRKLRDLEPEFIDFILEALSRREGGAYVTCLLYTSRCV